MARDQSNFCVPREGVVQSSKSLQVVLHTWVSCAHLQPGDEWGYVEYEWAVALLGALEGNARGKQREKETSRRP